LSRIAFTPARAAVVAALAYFWTAVVLVLLTFTFLVVDPVKVRAVAYTACNAVALLVSALVFLHLLGDAVIVLPPRKDRS
jgi:hypothetical protein